MIPFASTLSMPTFMGPHGSRQQFAVTNFLPASPSWLAGLHESVLRYNCTQPAAWPLTYLLTWPLQTAINRVQGVARGAPLKVLNESEARSVKMASSTWDFMKI